jgi:hypothetical protein
MDENGSHRPLGQACIHHQRHICRGQIFADRRMNGMRQPLPAIFDRRRQPEPAALAVLLKGFLEALRRGHRAVVMTNAAFRVADPVQRLHDVLGEFRPLAEDRFQHVAGRIGKACKIGIALVSEHVIEHEERIAHGRGVGRHACPPDGLAAGRMAMNRLSCRFGNVTLKY